jgi:thioredoxin reductase (NADPH)
VTVDAARAGSLPETPDEDGAFPRLNELQIAELAEYGRRVPIVPGQVLFREGDAHYAFHVVLDGKVAVVDAYGTPAERLIAVHGPGRFLGELGLLTGQAAFFTAVAVDAGEALRVPVEGLRDLAVRDAALGDLVLRAYLQRRWMLIGLGAGLRIIGSRFDPDTRRLREFAARNRVPHRWIDLEEDTDAEALLRGLGVSPEETPVVVWRGTDVLRNPSNAEVARLLGLKHDTTRQETVDLMVVGAGPSGLAGAVYGSSEGLRTVCVDGVATGGQAATSSRIENYLGFPAGISGAELADRGMIQAEKFGAEIDVPCEAVGLERDDGDHVVHLDDGTSLRARTLVIATGARYRKLPLVRLEEFEGAGVYYAATAMEVQLCKGDPVVVVGGGNSAGQATVFLSQFTEVVRLMIRGDDLGKDMSRYLVDRIERIPNVEVLPNTEVRELVGEGGLQAVVAEDNRTGSRREVEARALFVFIGAEPHTGWLGDQVALDAKGFVRTGRDAAPYAEAGLPLPLETSRPGVFAVGDVRSGSIKRVASAVGEGSMAVRLVHEHLADRCRVDTRAPQTKVSS